MQALRSLVLAFSSFSRIPMPCVEATEQDRRCILCFFPLVGAAVALVMALWLWMCDALRVGALLRGAIGAALPLLVTGGIHMDGFMDTSDALSTWQSKERRLEILKDSHVGAFAAMRAAMYLLVMAGLLSEATLRAAPLVGMCFVASRALSAWTSVRFTRARPNGMLDDLARPARMRAVEASSALYVAACAVVWAICGGWICVLCAATAALCTIAYRRMAYAKFGGVTGDLAGWFLQVTELSCVAAVVLGGKIL